MQNETTYTHYVTRHPFPGFAESLYDPAADIVAWSDGKSLAEYQRHNGEQFRVLDETEYKALYEGYLRSRVTDPKEITRDRYWDMLEVLPPCRWTTVSGVEMFHISERLSGNLVSWFAKCGERYFEFVDFDNRKSADIADKVGAAL